MKTQEDIFQFVNEKSLKPSLKWTLSPFPHVVIDNFLIKEVFEKITNDLRISPKSDVYLCGTPQALQNLLIGL